ncbi:hypothetical protein DMS50_24810, partial [Salmonella enterica]|nr:hypothetical protein [Salmonella enterica]
MKSVCFIFILFLMQGCVNYHEKLLATNSGTILKELNKRASVYESTEKLKKFIANNYKDDCLNF